MTIPDKSDIQLFTRKEIPRFLTLSILGYLISLTVLYLTTSRNVTIVLATILLLLYGYSPKRTLFLVYNIIFFSGLAGTSFADQAVWLIDNITLPSSGGKSMIAVKFELFPLVVYGILLIQLVLNKKVLDRNLKAIWRILLLFFIMTILSSFILGTSKYELFLYLVKFSMFFAIIVLLTTLDLTTKDLLFMFRYILFTITVIQIGLILVGWGVPTIRGTYINPDNWGGSEGTRSINFISMIAIGCLYFIYKITLVKATTIQNWIYLLCLTILIIAPFSTMMLGAFIVTVLIVIAVQARRKLATIFLGLSVLLLIYFSYSFLSTNFVIFRTFSQATAQKVPEYLSVGIMNNPKIQSILEVGEMYYQNPETILLGKGPGMYISGASVQAGYKGPQEDITGGGQTKNIPFIVTFAESGLAGGIVIYTLLFMTVKIFYSRYKHSGHKLSFYGFSIAVFLIVTSFVQESFEYPSIALLGGSLLGIIYMLFPRQNHPNAEPSRDDSQTRA